MDELRGRFQRLDRVTAPNLWNEAVGRAAELPMPRRWTLSPNMALVAAALLVAALAGTVAVGSWINDRLSPEPTITTYDNGMLVSHDGCRGLTGLDPVSFAPRDLVVIPDGCGEVEQFTWPVGWTADGSRLAYWLEPSTGVDQGGSLWLYESATGTTRQLSSCAESYCALSMADLSPDGNLLAYTGFREGDPGVATLFVRGVDSEEPIGVSLSGFPERPAFSPDGRYVAFSQLGGRSGVYLVDVSRFDEGVVSEPILIHGIVQASELSWSPDGNWLVMTQTGGLGHLGDEDRPDWNQQISMSGQGIVIVSANGTQSRVLATLPTGSADRSSSPTWSADSQSVAYMTWPVTRGVDGRSFELWTTPIEGGEPTRIHDAGCCASYPAGIAWSPDGEWIAFAHQTDDGEGQTGTFVIRPDGTGLRRISSDVLDLVWQPLPRE